MDAKELNKLADSLLRKNGYDADGSKLKGASKRQKFFECKTVIKIPMGNRR